MARPLKSGISYFPLDVDIFDDPKFLPVQERYGPLGEVVYLRLLCLIYRNGYYYRFTDMDTLAAVVAKSIGFRWARGTKTVREVILRLAECDLFDLRLLSSGLLTSAGIQRRYQKAVGRRRSQGGTEYWLIDEEGRELADREPEKKQPVLGARSMPKKRVIVCNNPVNVDNNPVIVCNNATKKSKVNKSKVKKMTARRLAVNVRAKKTDDVIIKEFHELLPGLARANEDGSPKNRAIIRESIKQGRTVADYRSAFMEVSASSFLRGASNSGWRASLAWIIAPAHLSDILAGRYRDWRRPAAPLPATGTTDGGSFDTKEFFEEALRRTYEGERRDRL